MQWSVLSEAYRKRASASESYHGRRMSLSVSIMIQVVILLLLAEIYIFRQCCFDYKTYFHTKLGKFCILPTVPSGAAHKAAAGHALPEPSDNYPAACVMFFRLPFVLRAIHRAGQVAFQGAVGQIRLLDAAILSSSSRRNAILRHCRADMPAR